MSVVSLTANCDAVKSTRTQNTCQIVFKNDIPIILVFSLFSPFLALLKLQVSFLLNHPFALI